MKRYLILPLCALASLAHGQTFSSFQSVTSISGVSSSLVGNNLTVSFAPGATVVYNSATYTVNSVFGAWLMQANPATLSATAGSGNPAGWSYNTSTGGGGVIFGYETPPNSGILAGGSATFNFGTLAGASAASYGYHMRFNENLPTGFNSLFITGNPVPEPATLFGLVALAGTMVAKRRKKGAVSL